MVAQKVTENSDCFLWCPGTSEKELFQMSNVEKCNPAATPRPILDDKEVAFSLYENSQHTSLLTWVGPFVCD